MASSPQNNEKGAMVDLDVLASEDLQMMGYKQEMSRVRHSVSKTHRHNIDITAVKRVISHTIQ
jgi:hypothetical protein